MKSFRDFIEYLISFLSKNGVKMNRGLDRKMLTSYLDKRRKVLQNNDIW
jgi:hypothetical protein